MKQPDYIVIEAKDCHSFCLRPGEEDVMNYFITSVSKENTFYFSSDNKNDDDPPLAEYDYANQKWRAGRLVGEASFFFKGIFYKVIIKPRFGELYLFRMCEEIFNVKLAETAKALNRHQDFQFLIKKIISFLWLNMLAKANKHGLPRIMVSKSNKGSKVRGRINVRQSIKPYYETSELISFYREKEINDTIAQILFQSYNILIKDYHLGDLNIPNNASDAIIQLQSAQLFKRTLTKTEYLSIRYKDIYRSFKPIVDFSWDLIQRKKISTEIDNTATEKGYSFFIDMAEVWELYLKSILKKYLASKGWATRNEVVTTYHGKIFQRSLIPDIIFQRDEDIIVMDAKYKRMKMDRIDIDREDYFQIHTYIHYYQQIKNVIGGGLLYPFSVSFSDMDEQRSRSQTLFGCDKANTKFLVDGIDLSFLIDDIAERPNITTKFKEKETEFLKRISDAIL